MAKQKIKVLFFIASTIATEEENEAMNEFNARHTVCIRNASMIGDNDAIEPFDVVAGCVPAKYAAAFELQGPPVMRQAPKVPAAKAPEAKPAPAPAPTPVAAPAGAAKPKTPEAKPAGAVGWKPNA